VLRNKTVVTGMMLTLFITFLSWGLGIHILEITMSLILILATLQKIAPRDANFENFRIQLGEKPKEG
jgi:endonuclease/exonuclease/phosphatase (EEP) superfamily protein YafD